MFAVILAALAVTLTVTLIGILPLIAVYLARHERER